MGKKILALIKLKFKLVERLPQTSPFHFSEEAASWHIFVNVFWQQYVSELERIVGVFLTVFDFVWEVRHLEFLN